MPGFEMYDRVEANYMGSGKWYSGIIVDLFGGIVMGIYSRDNVRRVQSSSGFRPAFVPFCWLTGELAVG